MAVQRKSQKNAPGEKKPVSWVKIVAVGFVVLVVVMCILSFCNFSNFFRGDTGASTPSTSVPVNEGDHVAVYFATNTEGKTVFSNFAQDGNNTGAVYSTYAKADSNITTDDLTSFTIKIGDESIPYKITPAEQNSISKAIVGKNYGDMTGVGIGDSGSDIRECSAADLTAAGCDMSTLKAGDVVPMKFTYTDEKGEEKQYARCGVVTSVADDLSKASLNFGSDSVIILVAGKYTS